MPTQPNATRTDIITLLQQGHSNSRIVRELRVDKHRVRRIREELGLPTYVPTEQTRTAEDKWKQFARPVHGGHMEWTGERVTTSGTPVMRYKDQCISPAGLAFEIHHGRPPQGYAIADCGVKHCIAPGHVNDAAGRQAKRQELRHDRGLGDRPDTCLSGHDQSEHGRLQRDGRPYCDACKRAGKSEPEANRAARASAREAVRRDIEAMLREGTPQIHIASQLGVAPATVQRIREALGLPAPRPGRRTTYASLEEAFRQGAEPVEGGHVLWTGYRDKDGTPRICYRQQPQAAPRVAFLLHHGREPVGKALPTCGVKGCIAGEHLADRPMREANQRADRAFSAIFGEAA